MPWAASNAGGGSDTLNYYWPSLQMAAKVTFPSDCVITQMRLMADGDWSDNARFVIWEVAGAVLARTDSFSFGDYSGLEMITLDLDTHTFLDAGDYWAGMYQRRGATSVRSVDGAGSSYVKIPDYWDSYRFPDIVSMADYSETTSSEITVEVFYITAPIQVSDLVVSRISDNNMSLTWTNDATTDQPIDSYRLWRYDNVSMQYYIIENELSGTLSSYSDTTTIADRKYKYAIDTKNEAGWGYVNMSTAYINTTPAAPTNVASTRLGTTVGTAWTDNSTVEDNYEIEKNESTDEGVTWEGWTEDLLPDQAANTVSYTDISPYAYGKYRIRAIESINSLTSAWVEGNDVISITPPSAPTGMVPDSIAYDAVGAYTFQWTHNPVDGTAQTKYSLQYRVVGAAWPGTPQHDEVTLTANLIAIVGATFTNGTEYEWQVKTWGSHATASDWSDTAYFAAVTTPVATITDPTVATTYKYSELRVEWTYTQAESSSEVLYICTLYDENDVYLNSRQSSQTFAAGTTGHCIFFSTLTNDTDYKVTVKVMESAGLWSAETEVEFTTEFLEPAIPTITLKSNKETGSVNVTIVNPAVDPFEHNEDSTEDSYVDLDTPTTNYDGTGELKVADDTAGGTTVQRILLNFDLSGFVGETIVSAQLQLYRKEALVAGIDSAVYYAKTAWTEGAVTHNTIPTLDATAYDDHTHTVGAGLEYWNLIAFLTDIADETITDYTGLAVVATTTDGSEDTFYDDTASGLEPVLYVETPEIYAQTSYNSVYRSIAGGAWELVATSISKNTTITDYVPSVSGNNNYYCKAVSTTPSSINSAEVDIDLALTGMFFLNGGSAFSEVVRLVGDVSITEARSRSQSAKQFAGRTYPVKYQGNSKQQDINFSADCPITKYNDLVSIIEYIGNVMYRDWRGRRFYCMLQGTSFDKKDNLAYQFSATIIRLESE